MGPEFWTANGWPSRPLRQLIIGRGSQNSRLMNFKFKSFYFVGFVLLRFQFDIFIFMIWNLNKRVIVIQSSWSNSHLRWIWFLSFLFIKILFDLLISSWYLNWSKTLSSSSWNILDKINHVMISVLTKSNRFLPYHLKSIDWITSIWSKSNNSHLDSIWSYPKS